MAEWLERMREVQVTAVATALGVESTTRGKWTAPCPSCNAAKRHTKSRDRRGAIGIRRDGAGWRCFQCDEAGDALDFTAWHVGGSRFRDLPEHRKLEVREWCSAWLGLDGPNQVAPQRPTISPLRAAEPEPPPSYPPLEEVEALWRECVRVDEVDEVAQWLTARRIDAQSVADRDLARALPLELTGHMPRWTWFRQGDHGPRVTWHDAGYLLIAQMVDARGAVRSLLARCVREGVEPKSRAASGFERRGLVLACPLGRQVLASGRLPAWWPSDLPLEVQICEGEKKWCIRCTLHSDGDAFAPVALGIESGSWTDELAARIPDGACVYIATDPDDAGAKYATKIVRSLYSRSGVRVVLRPGYSLEAIDQTVRCTDER
jgi:hypothetical protein